MRTAGTLVLLSLLTLGCDGKSAVPAFGVVALVDEPQRGPAGPKGAKGDPGPQGPQGEPGERDSIDGSRLRARYIEGADGSRQPLGDWLDSETGLPCKYREAEDGELRCLPDAFQNIPTYPTFLDPACEQATLRVNAAAAPPPKYGVAVFFATGDVAYFMVGEKVPTPAVTYRSLAPGACEEDPAAPGLDHFLSVDVLPPAFFVAGTVVTVE